MENREANNLGSYFEIIVGPLYPVFYVYLLKGYKHSFTKFKQYYRNISTQTKTVFENLFTTVAYLRHVGVHLVTLVHPQPETKNQMLRMDVCSRWVQTDHGRWYCICCSAYFCELG